MPIKSYVAYAREGQKKELREKILQIAPSTLAVESSSHDLLVVTTDIESDQEDKEIYQRFLDIPSLKNLTLVSGYSEEAIVAKTS